VTAPAAGPPAVRPDPPAPARSGIGRPAVLIGVITGLANVVGFARQLVFAHTVAYTSVPLATAYATANQVPNIIYAIVLGGALTGMVVPVLARPAADGGRAEVRQTSSALLTWTLLLLVPVALVIALAARPLITLLLQHPVGPDASMRSAGAGMLTVFAPQIVLYGLAVVGYGILQAHRRFTAPALAPVLSSVVVAVSYVAFVTLDHGHAITSLPASAQYMLSGGTTAGVAALAVTALVPTFRLRLRLRPALHFPPGVAARVRALALAGLAAVIAQNVSSAVVIVLANAHGAAEALVLYNYGWQVFFVPYAVLAVPIATSAFPVLSAAAAGERDRSAAAPSTTVDSGIASDRAESDRAEFDRAVASSSRAAVLVSWLGWVSTLRGLIIPGLFSGFAAFLFRQYFLNFPKELEEAGRVDGLQYWGAYWRIVVPNSLNFFAAIAVITFIGNWNSFLWPLVIGQSDSSWTIQVVMSTFITAQTINLHELFAAAAVAIVPLVLIFIFLQRYLVQGAAQTGIKG